MQDASHLRRGLAPHRRVARYKSVSIPGHADPAWDTDNGADGMAVHSEGRVYAATNVGVEVFSPRGELLGVIPVQWGAENNRIRHPQNPMTIYGSDSGQVLR